MGGRVGAGRPSRAAWMARTSKSVALAFRARHVSMTLANKARLLEPTSERVPKLIRRAITQWRSWRSAALLVRGSDGSPSTRMMTSQSLRNSRAMERKASCLASRYFSHSALSSPTCFAWVTTGGAGGSSQISTGIAKSLSLASKTPFMRLANKFNMARPPSAAWWSVDSATPHNLRFRCAQLSAGLLALLAALALAGWELWRQDVHESPPTYLAYLSTLAAGLTMWSALYATLGRLLGGPDRFFTHLLIVCCAYMGATLLHNALDWVAFAYYWLWPLRISNYATVVVVALTVRAHLRIVDPRHWPVMRWGVAVVTIMAIAVPVGQTWISSKRLTHVQLMNVTEHPALRLAEPVDISSFMQTTLQLQTRANQQRAQDHQDDSEDQEQN